MTNISLRLHGRYSRFGILSHALTRDSSRGEILRLLTSVLAIHKLREGETSRNIESCRFVFVTNNIDFIQAFNKYYRNNVDRDTFQLSISVNSLSAIAWIKCGEVENLSETELLKNAYCAMQPILKF